MKQFFKKNLPLPFIKWLVIWKDSIEWFFLNSIISSFPSQTFRIIVLRIMGAKIPMSTAVYSGIEYRNPKGLTIGVGTALGHRAILDCRMGLNIGKSVCFGTEVMIWTLHHDYNDIDFKAVGGEVNIGDYVWLGSRCVILPGITIGNGAVIAAGAVVTKDVLPFTVVGGIPAKVIAKRDEKKYKYKPNDYKLHLV